MTDKDDRERHRQKSPAALNGIRVLDMALFGPGPEANPC
jgi:hypothetical protein